LRLATAPSTAAAYCQSQVFTDLTKLALASTWLQISAFLGRALSLSKPVCIVVGRMQATGVNYNISPAGAVMARRPVQYGVVDAADAAVAAGAPGSRATWQSKADLKEKLL